MLYRFHNADTQPQLTSDVTALTRALPSGTITGTSSWLTVKTQESGSIAIIVPFVVAFGVIGLAMSVVIVGNVVNGAVVSGYRRIGVLKSIGFTPAQVVAAYVAQAGIPALAGTLAGVVVGNVLSVPLLSQTAHRLRGRQAARAAFGRYRGAAADVRPGGAGGAAARAAGRTAQRRRGHRDRARPADRPRLRRAPAARPATAPPPGDDRPGRPVRTPGPHRGHDRRDRVRRHRGDLRRRAELIADQGGERPVARGLRAGADLPGYALRPCPEGRQGPRLRRAAATRGRPLPDRRCRAPGAARDAALGGRGDAHGRRGGPDGPGFRPRPSAATRPGPATT